MPALYSNNAISKLASPISGSDVTLTVGAGHGARFRSPTGGDYQILVISTELDTYEVVHLTGLSGDTLTVTRGIGGVNQAWGTGADVVAALTAEGLREIRAGTAGPAAVCLPGEAIPFPGETEATIRRGGATYKRLDGSAEAYSAGVHGALLAEAPWLFSTVQPIDLSTFARRYDVAHDGSKFVVCGDGFTWHSTDGLSWTEHPAGFNRCIAWSGSEFIVGRTGRAYSVSADGITWTDRTLPGTSATINAVMYDGYFFYAALSNGYIYSSPDAVTWTARGLGTSTQWLSMAYGGGHAVAVGFRSGQPFNVISKNSTADIGWTIRNTGQNNRLRDVLYDGAQFVAVSDAGDILTATDPASWTITPSGIGAPLYSIAYGAGLYVVSTNDGRLFQSPNLVDWSLLPSPSLSPGFMHYLNGLLIVTDTLVKTTILVSDLVNVKTLQLPTKSPFYVRTD